MNDAYRSVVDHALNSDAERKHRNFPAAFSALMPSVDAWMFPS
jgi:hypothetical protein